MRNAALKCVFIVSNVIQANKLLQVKKNPIDPLVLSVFNDYILAIVGPGPEWKIPLQG